MAIDSSSLAGTSQYLVRSAKSFVAKTDAKITSPYGQAQAGGAGKVEAGTTSDNQAHVFNENGFFGSISADAAKSGAFRQILSQTRQGEAAAPDGADSQNIDSEMAAGNSKVGTDIADAARSMDARQFREYVGDLLRDIGPPGNSNLLRVEGGPKSKVPMAEMTPQIANVNLATVDGEAFFAAPASGTAAADTNADAGQMLTKAKIVELITSDAAERSNSPVRIALQQLDSGLKLVAQLNGLKKQDRLDIREMIAGVLAQYGFGRHELLLNGKLYSTLFPDA